MALLQQLYDRGISGSIQWSFDSNFGAMLISPPNRRASVLLENARQIADWFHQQVPDLAGADDLRLVQILHNAKFSGSVAWLPPAGFWVQLNDVRHSCALWSEAAAWMRAKGDEVLVNIED